MVISGVYKITNTESGKFYIGSSKDMDNRKSEHWNALRRGDHINPILQNSWNYHGESVFTFEIVETCEADQCLIREQHYLDLLQPFKGVGYNINRKALGGDCFTFHPNKEAIREKLRMLSSGENNGMFGKKHTEEAIAKQREKAAGRFTLPWYVERHGPDAGPTMFSERRKWLASRKINYTFDNKRAGTTPIVEKDRGSRVKAGRKALIGRREELRADIRSGQYTVKEMSMKYGVSITTIKSRRKELT